MHEKVLVLGKSYACFYIGKVEIFRLLGPTKALQSGAAANDIQKETFRVSNQKLCPKGKKIYQTLIKRWIFGDSDNIEIIGFHVVELS